MALEQLPKNFDPSQGGAGPSRAAVANAIVGLYSECYGKGPTRAKAYLVEDLCVCVLQDIFTRVERTLIEAGDEETVRSTRLEFQTAMRAEFRCVAEAALGRPVLLHMSELDVDGDTAVEVFILAPNGGPPA